MSFARDLDLVTQHVLRSRSHFDVWWEYAGDETKPKYAQARDEHPYFFEFDAHAHFMTAVIYLSRLYETKGNTLNLTTLLRRAEAEKLDQESVARANESLVEAAEIAGKIILLRNNTIAHTSAKLTNFETFERVDLTPNKLRSATEVALSIVNELRACAGVPVWEFRTDPVDELRTVLERISS